MLGMVRSNGKAGPTTKARKVSTIIYYSSNTMDPAAVIGTPNSKNSFGSSLLNQALASVEGHNLRVYVLFVQHEHCLNLFSSCH